jgi:hypothetical protein
MAEGLDMFRRGANAAGGRMIPSICPLGKELWLDGCMSGSRTQKGWELGAITLAEDLHDWGRRTVPLFNCTLEFALQLR